MKEVLKDTEIELISKDALNYLEELCSEFCFNLTKNSIPFVFPRKTIKKEDLMRCLDKRSMMDKNLPKGHLKQQPNTLTDIEIEV